MKVDVLVEIIRQRVRKMARERRSGDEVGYAILMALSDLADDIEDAKDELEGNQ